MTSTYDPLLDPSYVTASRVPQLLGGWITPIPIELFTTGLRLWIKLRRGSKEKLAFDDYLMAFVTLVGVGMCVIGLSYGPRYGFGRHVFVVPLDHLQIFMKADYVYSHFYLTGISFTKLSVLALYHRIFVTPGFQLVVKCTAAVIILWWVAMEIAMGLQCRPIEAFWNLSITGKCLNLVTFTYFTTITNLIFDIWIFILPIRVIFRLQIPQTRKVGLSFLFSFGLATCTISAVRMTYAVTQASLDFTWAAVPLAILSAWEVLGGILCANLPILYKFIAKAFQSIKSGVRSNRSGSQSNNVSSTLRSSSRINAVKSWIKLENGSSASAGDHPYLTTTSEVYVSNKSADEEDEAAEMQALHYNTIRVERRFEQEIYHDGLPGSPPEVYLKRMR